MVSNVHPKYIVSIKPKEGSRFNPMHEVADGSIVTVIDLTVGECGWIAYKSDEVQGFGWHRIRTSPIQNLTMDENGNISVETQNTYYILNRI